MVFKDNGAPIGSCSGAPVAVCTVSNLSVGNHNIQAEYLGDGNMNGSNSNTTVQVIEPANQAPAITTQSVNQTVCEGALASFTSAASGYPAPTVVWQVSADGGTTWSNVPGGTSATLTITAAAGQNGYLYHAVWVNSSGGVTSNAAMLTVNTAPVVTLHPASQSVPAGSTVTFSAAASGTPAPAVQWQQSTDGGLNWAAIPGAISTSYSFTAGESQNGYRYRAVFTNACASMATAAAVLTVTASGTARYSTTSTATGRSITANRGSRAGRFSSWTAAETS